MTRELVDDALWEIIELGEQNNPGAGVINAFSGQQFLQGNSVLSSTAIDFDGPLLN